MSVPLLLTILAGAATFVGAFLGVIGQRPSNRMLAFALGFAAGIMLLISLMEMLPAALHTEGMSPLLGYSMFLLGLLGYFALDRLLPHQHPQDLMTAAQKPRSLRRTAILLTLGISLHNFPEGVATFVTASSDLELGLGIALAVAFLVLGPVLSPVVIAAIMAAVAGIMVALSVDELMPLAREIDPHNNPSYGVLCGMTVMGFSLTLLQSSGIG